ncbi:hypothetical protein J4E81_009183 [Alternaria sp. BMP 2799]|nr:hypothetical protein J4E81_009183 [Alternaria sp. BMP 2799]
MFTSQSGGGSELTINNTTEVVPSGLMNDRKVPSLYTRTEAEIYKMWIKLLRTISSHDFSGTGEKRKRVESDAEYNSGTESDTDIEEYSNRVRRSYDLRSRPTTPTAKKAEADECDLSWLDEEDVGDEGVKEESDEEMIDVEDGSERDMSKEDMDEEDLIGRLPDGTMQDEDLSDSSDTVMTDETMRPPVGRNYVCVPSLKSGNEWRQGVSKERSDAFKLAQFENASPNKGM